MKSKKQKKILLALLSSATKTMIKKFLKDTFDLIEADNQSEALSLCKSEKISLVIASAEFKDNNGLEVTAMLRKEYDKNKLPVLLIITHHKREDILKALDTGINDYILKPFPEELLMSKIHKLGHKISANDAKLSKIVSKELFFNGIPDSQVAFAINTCSETVTKKKGDIICKQGEKNFDLFILVEGECDVIFNDDKVSEVRACDTIGEMGFIGGKVRSATVKATKPCKLVVFKKDLFGEFLNEDRVIYETICENVIQILSKRIMKSNEVVGWLIWA